MESEDWLNKDKVANLCGFITENVCKSCGKPVTFKAAFEGYCSTCWMWGNGHTDGGSKKYEREDDV